MIDYGPCLLNPNDQVGHAFANHLHGIDPVVRFPHDLIVFVFQQHAYGQTDDRMIVDDKN